MVTLNLPRSALVMALLMRKRALVRPRSALVVAMMLMRKILANAATCSENSTSPDGYIPNAARTNGVPCPAGTHSVGEGKTECIPCAVGYYGTNKHVNGTVATHARRVTIKMRQVNRRAKIVHQARLPTLMAKTHVPSAPGEMGRICRRQC